MIGFSASAVLRCTAGALFCLGAVALVWLVESRPEAAPAPPVVPAAGLVLRSLPLSVESTYPVARWRVMVLGAEQPGSPAGPYAWHGTASAPRGEDVVVIAEAAAEASAPHRGLRIRLGDARERVVWGAGDVVVAEPVP